MPQLVKTDRLILFGFFTNRSHRRDVRVTYRIALIAGLFEWGLLYLLRVLVPWEGHA
ncbi:MAG: hypothetical protein JWQ50_3796 [Caballeronia mineralivorans]|nr:hypothetical protein [Caballeronia mineralivorans]